MLLAIVTDLLRVAGCDVATTWDGRLGSFPHTSRRLTVHRTDADNESSVFENLCRDCDAALIIAPEFHGILAGRVRKAAALTQVLGPTESFVELSTDKLRLSQFLADNQIPSIPASRLDPERPRPGFPYPLVLKPQDGAGSVETFLIRNRDEFDLCVKELRSSDFHFLQQPFIPGETLSAAAVCSRGQVCEILPVCRQVLSDNGRFEYSGAEWSQSLTNQWQQKSERLITRVLSALPGAGGYLGFDMIGEDDGSIRLVDLNPRLTTGYLGWRQRTESNLAALLLQHDRKIAWTDTSGHFQIH